MTRSSLSFKGARVLENYIPFGIHPVSRFFANTTNAAIKHSNSQVFVPIYDYCWVKLYAQYCGF